jgi:hypothetical protein
VRAGPSDRIARSSLRRGVRVSSWLGSRLLAESVPVLSGAFEEDGSQEIPEKVTLTVNRVTPSRSWDPTADPRHPLAKNGQRLNVTSIVASPRGRQWELPLGWFQVEDWEISADESTVSVTALGLLQVPAGDDFASPEQPRPGGTFASEIRRLMSAGIPVSIDPALADRPCPGGFVWEQDRLTAIYDLAGAWPARLQTGADGVVRVLPPLGLIPEPVVTLKHGTGGVVIQAPRKDSRAGVYSAVVATSSEDSATSTPVSAEYVTTAGPYAVSTYGVVRGKISSPLLGTAAACYAAARTHAEASQRQGQTIEVVLPPDPRIQRGDAVALERPEGTYRGWVLKAAFPLTVDGTAMTLSVGVPG